MQNRLITLLLFAALPALCLSAERVTGPARVVDGDSLDISGVSIRLFGVDAPEGQQPCTRNGAAWDCGGAASERMRQLVGADSIVCERLDTDNYGRTVARCMNGNIDLAAELTLSGLALAYQRYSLDYVDEEATAKAARRGIWAGEFQAPWDYRRNPQLDPVPSPRPVNKDECRIKGNINREGVRIYHMPGSPSYTQTIIDESKGERWFCSEEEARAEGWRAPRG